MYKVSLPINVLRCHGTKEFIVHTPVLDLSTCGKTESQALRMFGEAVQLLFGELEKMGTMDEVLSELGWTKVYNQKFGWIPPEVLHQKKYPVRVTVGHA